MDIFLLDHTLDIIIFNLSHHVNPSSTCPTHLQMVDHLIVQGHLQVQWQLKM